VVTSDRSVDLDPTISALVRENQPITIAALGGMNVLSTEHATSALFPYVAYAIVADWHSLTDEERAKARQLIALSIKTTASGLALSDICRAIVPAAAPLGLAVTVKAALRDRVGQRDDQQAAGVASTALRWLTNLAVVDDSARGALVDALSEVSLNSADPPSFTIVAAQVAGIAYDIWRDPVATACLTRLVDGDSSSPDAWFALGQARLVDALSAPDREACLRGLSMTLECFDIAAESTEQRPDAAMYASTVRFVLGWTAGAPAAMLAAHFQRAREALGQYLMLGYGLPEQPEWTRPRYAAETAWMSLIAAMEQVADRQSGESPWYDAGIAIGALADVYRIANALTPARSADVLSSDVLPDLIAPRLVAPFVEHVERFGYLSRWLRESDVPGAEEFAEFVSGRVEQVMPPKASAAGPHPALAELLGSEPPGDLANESLLDLIEQRLQDRKALERQKFDPVVTKIVERTMSELSGCTDFAGPVKEDTQPIIVAVVRFLAFCLNAQRGGDNSHTAYLFDLEATEGQLQQHLTEWFYGACGFTNLITEAQHIGAGRIDLMLVFNGFRFVIELKREKVDATQDGLSAYLRQEAAYQATDIALGMLVVLDLTTGPLPDHIRDNVWVDVVPASSLGGTDRYVIVVRVPGNRVSPSQLSR
jgi:hypothetical protein